MGISPEAETGEGSVSVTRGAILRKATDGEKAHALRWYETRRILAAHADGATVPEIAERFRLHRETIRKILRRSA